ncbi:HIT family protein [Candidatus Woesearchaeota archaeon]|nr:HIT family protein [Candidatus Woesearchaeota archaeon]
MVEIAPEEEDQQQAMQEKIKNMTPEQLKEYQKQQCIFCQIISGKVQSKKIYEDERCIAILDINPANPGHILLLPKEHYAVMPQIPEEDIGHLFMVSKALSNAMLKGLKVSGTNIFVANGVAAGQRAQHFMIHVIPRKENDGITAFTIPQRQVPDSDQDKIKKRLVEGITKVFGLKAPKVEETEERTEEKPEEEKKPEKKEKKAEEEPKEKPKKKTKKEIKKEIEEKPVSKKEDVDLDKISGLFK